MEEKVQATKEREETNAGQGAEERRMLEEEQKMNEVEAGEEVMEETKEGDMEVEEGLTLEKFEEASEVVKNVTLETKLVFSEYLSAQTGNKVYLKPENMQLTGAYKLRGAYYKISTLTDEERAKGLITASAGNHAQGLSLIHI